MGRGRRLPSRRRGGCGDFVFSSAALSDVPLLSPLCFLYRPSRTVVAFIVVSLSLETRLFFVLSLVLAETCRCGRSCRGQGISTDVLSSSTSSTDSSGETETSGSSDSSLSLSSDNLNLASPPTDHRRDRHCTYLAMSSVASSSRSGRSRGSGGGRAVGGAGSDEGINSPGRDEDEWEGLSGTCKALIHPQRWSWSEQQRG
jgi:hypothetical protein